MAEMNHLEWKSARGTSAIVLIIAMVVLLVLAFIGLQPDSEEWKENDNTNLYQHTNLDQTRFNILVSAENQDLEKIITQYAAKKGFNVHIDYAGTLDIINHINRGEPYDAMWISNSIWSYMIQSKAATVKDGKATCLTPVTFAIKKSKAEELGFVGKTVYTKDIVDAISEGKLKFLMANPTTTNSGASAYFGMLYTLAGNPEVLTEEILNREEVQSKLKLFFSGLERSSGSEDFLEQSFIKGEYEAVVSYESSIIKINKELEAQGKETLYAIYPVDGVSMCDNPFYYIDHKDANKKIIFGELQSYLLSEEGQQLLQEQGRRTWYGGINSQADKTIFNPNWGIDTTKYITPVKYPSTTVMKQALVAYQSSLRKPVHVVFCLDYSGSMYGEGIRELRNAMQYILTEESAVDYIQFTGEDKVDVVAFSGSIKDIWSSLGGDEAEKLLQKINQLEPGGSTALYLAASKGVELLKEENTDQYNVSIVLMTDGVGNVGSFSSLTSVYRQSNSSIPIYSIMFGDADSRQLEEIAALSNGKVFDGKADLVAAFKEVRGYN